MKRSHVLGWIRTHWPWLGAIFLVLILGVYGWQRYRALRTQYSIEQQTIATLQQTIANLQNNLSLTAYERDRLTFVLDQTQQTSADLQDQKKTLEEQVQDYAKLQSLDPELLKKYSKVYFLNEQYVPSKLATIDPSYANNGKTLQFHAQALPYLNSLLHDAAADGLGLRVTSAYRSFGTQASLKAGYTVVYGSGTANRFSADQGYSEHQLGTTVDFTTVKTKTLSTAFETTPESKWLRENAYKYGFILSYPKNNKYYIYEPWHWRFVGVALATKLHNDNEYLYDLDQRDIDTYLLHIFD